MCRSVLRAPCGFLVLLVGVNVSAAAVREVPWEAPFQEDRIAATDLLFEGIAWLTPREWFGTPSVALEEESGRDGPFPSRSGDEVSDLLLVRRGGIGQLLRFSGGRFRAEYLDNFDDLTRLGGRLLLDTRSRLGFDAEWHYWRERMAAEQRHTFWTGDFNLVYRFGEGTPVRFHSGIGVNWLHETGDSHFGFNSTYAVDLLVKRHWLLSSSIDIGRLAGSRLLQGRVTIGRMIGRMEVFGGYDYFKLIGRERHGLIAGAGIWF